ncbi:Fc.00g018090.m01.CDS01 [Cosmosporella sp. VM-42]
MTEVEQPQAPVAVEAPILAPETVAPEAVAPEVVAPEPVKELTQEAPAVAAEAVPEPTPEPTPAAVVPAVEPVPEQKTEETASAPAEAAPEEKPKAPVVAEAHLVDTFHPPEKMLAKHPSKPHLANFEEYQQLYKESITQPDKFWGDRGRELLTWDTPFRTGRHGSLEHGDVSFFNEGKLNASYNCVDRHAFADPDRIAIIYEADDPADGRNVTYGELLREVSRVAWVLKQMGVRRGDTVAIYLPMIPEALIALLAVSRIGAIHSVIFAGFSCDSLRDRVVDANSKVVITTDEGKRGGKLIGTKKIVDDALKQCPDVKNVLVYKRTGADVPMTEGRDFWWHEEVEKWPSYLTPIPMCSEDPLFLLYTSGSTGKPKGILHTTGGYLLGAAMTGKYVFDLHKGDRHFCGGDVGWITGHTYVVYAPLLLGVTTVVFEGTPAYPNFSRYWDIIDKHQVTQFYVAPTALRLLKRAGDEHVRGEMKHLRVLGSVGEPIAAEIWKWYFEVVGKEEAQVVDTYWQTETGSHVIAPLAGITPTKPGSASLPFFGVEPAIVDPVSGEEIHGNDVEGVLCFKQSWPSMARTVWGDHKRFMDTYLNVYKGYYFTGDGAGRDHEGFYWIRGRVDDVVNVSGHRLSTAEIEAALLEHHAVAEAAVVGVADELTGQAVNAFVALKETIESSDALRKELVVQVRKSIGPFAAPKAVHVIPDMPKTRSGKIMRRILRKVLAGEEDQLGDISTLSDPSIVAKIIDIVHNERKRK